MVRKTVTDADAWVIEILRERLANPAVVQRMTLTELLARHKSG